MSVSLKQSFMEKGRQSSHRARDLNVIRYGSLDATHADEPTTQIQQIRKVKEGRQIERFSQGRDNEYSNLDYSDQGVFTKSKEVQMK